VKHVDYIMVDVKWVLCFVYTDTDTIQITLRFKSITFNVFLF
jgi:hypothetical protein